MFSPQKRIAIGLLTVLAGFLIVPDASAQSASQYDARLEAMRAARARAQQTSQTSETNVEQTAYQQGYDYAAPPAPPANNSARVTRLPRQAQRNTNPRTRTATPRESQMAPRTSGAPNGYTPRHLRTAQVYDEQITNGGSVIVDSSASMVAGAPVVSGDVYSEVISDGGCGCGDCQFGCGIGGCGLNGLLCRRCNTCSPINTPCCERGGCPPGTWENCWLSGLGRIFYNADYFTGATAFKGPAFNVNQVGALNDQLADDNFGLYAGVNFGIPLCRLTCGLFSAQFGVRTVQSNFNGNLYADDTRDQTFLTAGLYRRVDYGLQAGFVYDALREKWFTTTDTSQIRGDVAWLWQNGASFGFQFAAKVEDDLSSGTINDVRLDSLFVSTYDNYRFYYKRECECGGYTTLFGGVADDSRGLFGFDVDVPVGERTAVQTGLLYIIGEETPNVGGTDVDSWNLYMGLSFRPRGRSWYQYYDRPMFDVADNGTFLVRH